MPNLIIIFYLFSYAGWSAIFNFLPLLGLVLTKLNLVKFNKLLRGHRFVNSFVPWYDLIIIKL